MTSTSTQDLVCEPDPHTSHPQGYGTTDNSPPDENGRSGLSFRRRIIHLKEESSSYVDLTRGVLLLMFGHCVWTIILFFTLTIPLAMIIIGAIRIKECPLQPIIPIVIIIMGSLGMLSNVFHLVHRIKNIWDFSLPTRFTGIGLLTIMINILSFISFIAACVWVYRIYPPNYDSTRGLYCDKMLYLFSFWILNTVYIFIGIIFLFVLLGCCCAVIL
ncbi:transmembrane protein 272-like [Centruroides vittatus]|uniref:transmembrane protein 272-like n=1 Tax=Centruroides vittatus TaxID=120091 RepID=UPI00350F2433